MAGKTKEKAPAPDAVTTLTDEGERRTSAVRERQFPSLYGNTASEVAERTIDTSEPTADVHTKDFVTTRAAWGLEDHDAVHARNATAVRQAMLQQGLRTDARVEFVGEFDTFDPASVVLRYEVSATPAVVAEDFALRHMVVPQDGLTSEESAKLEDSRTDRLLASRDALRAGTPEENPPKRADDPTSGDKGGE